MGRYLPGMKKLLLLLLLLTTGNLVAQTADTLQASIGLNIAAQLATTDNLKNIYVFTASYTLEKFSPDLKLLGRYSNNRLGFPTAIDVSNPMKILLWYADFRTVVFLDRNMTVLGELNLIQAGFPEVRTVAAARDGNLWLYDEVAFKLRKISPEGAIIFESQDLNLVFDTRLSITCLYESDASLYAADAQMGLLQFDNYAQFSQNLPWKGITQFITNGNLLYHIQDDKLHVNLIQGFMATSHQLPVSVPGAPPVKRWLGHRAVLQQEEGMLKIYSF